MKKVLIIIISLLSILISCEKDAELQNKDYPYVITADVTDLTENSITFNGNILDVGDTEILEYGFIWAKGDPLEGSVDKVVFTSQGKTGVFSKKISTHIHKDRVQFVRAYVKSKDFLVYGNSLEFRCNGGIPPKIISITPSSGYVNDRITIRGDNFSNARSYVKVFFGGIEAVVSTSTENEIVTKVPKINNDMEVKITVQSYGKSTQSDSNFKAFKY